MLGHFCARGARRRSAFSILICFVVPLLVHNGPARGQTQLFTNCFPTPSRAPAKAWSQPSIDLFDAVERGIIEAQIVVRDANHARLMLTNKTAQGQAIRLPDVLAARPILAQFGTPGFGTNGNSVGQTGSIMAPQTVGGAPSQASQNSSTPGGGFPSFFNGNGLNNVFNVAPEQVRRIDIDCLCLEQGKPNPRSAVKYEVVPLTEVNDDPRLAEVLRAYGSKEADRETAQAAAWHLANEMSWNELAGLSQRIALNAERPLFNSQQLRQAKQLVDRTAASAAATRSVPTKQTIVPPKL